MSERVAPSSKVIVPTDEDLDRIASTTPWRYVKSKFWCAMHPARRFLGDPDVTVAHEQAARSFYYPAEKIAVGLVDTETKQSQKLDEHQTWVAGLKKAAEDYEVKLTEDLEPLVQNPEAYSPESKLIEVADGVSAYYRKLHPVLNRWGARVVINHQGFKEDIWVFYRQGRNRSIVIDRLNTDYFTEKKVTADFSAQAEFGKTGLEELSIEWYARTVSDTILWHFNKNSHIDPKIIQEFFLRADDGRLVFEIGSNPTLVSNRERLLISDGLDISLSRGLFRRFMVPGKDQELFQASLSMLPHIVPEGNNQTSKVDQAAENI